MSPMHWCARAGLGLALLFWAPFVVADDGPEALVAAYLEDFNDRMPASELVSLYWHEQVAVYADGSMQVLTSVTAVEQWLSDIQEAIAEDGWLRSETLQATVCRTDAHTALYPLRFTRHFDDGRVAQGAGTYILIRENQWRIAGIILGDPDRWFDCPA